MPSLFTHRYAAERIYVRLPENVRAEICSLPAYYLGAQGPDLFYFLRPYTDRGRLGRRMHGAEAYDAVSAFAENINSPQAFSYTAGYVTHAALDCVFHPYVFGITEKLLERGYSDKLYLHGYIESDLDTYFAEKYAADPAAPYRPEICENKQFAPLLPFFRAALGRLGVTVSERAVAAALRRFSLFSRAFTGAREGRRKFLFGAESLVRAGHTLSSRCRRAAYDAACLNESEEEWRDPAVPSFVSHESAGRVFCRAVEEGVRLVDLFYICRAAGVSLPREEFGRPLVAQPAHGNRAAGKTSRGNAAVK